jgi:protoporphyrin/coproporphyrin ferrochelatase
MSKGVLLVNLGSPDSASVPDVRRYLNEFLMDPRVIDVAWPLRRLIVSGILLKRPQASAHAYQSIWTTEGSPLVVIGKRVREKLQAHVGVPVELAMRYQNPSIEGAVRKLKEQGIDELLLIPLFPHYAMASYESAVEEVRQVARRKAPQMRIYVQPPYFADAGYIAALVASASNYLNQGFEHLLFSFHGVPERQIRKSDPSRHHCLASQNCCETPDPAHATCYRAQCFKTVSAFVNETAMQKENYSVTFQSRLGRDPWLQPFTDVELPRLAARGIKRLLVICPSFVADCLETLEEIGMRGRDSFLEAGGKELVQIPCLNEHPRWLVVLQEWIERFALFDEKPKPI